MRALVEPGPQSPSQDTMSGIQIPHVQDLSCGRLRGALWLPTWWVMRALEKRRARGGEGRGGVAGAPGHQCSKAHCLC